MRGKYFSFKGIIFFRAGIGEKNSHDFPWAVLESIWNET
jgi:hypothetical protein